MQKLGVITVLDFFNIKSVKHKHWEPVLHHLNFITFILFLFFFLIFDVYGFDVFNLMNILNRATLSN